MNSRTYLTLSSMASHQSEVLNLLMDLDKQYESYACSTGAVREAYKKVILDKCWNLSRICGQYYHKQLSEITSIETEVLHLNQYGEENQPSDTSAVPSASDPSQ